MILVVCWFELQVRWLSINLRFKWFGCQSIWDSSELVVNWFEIQMSWLSTDVWFKWFWLSVDVRFKRFGFRMFWDSSELVVNWFEVQMTWLSTDVCFKVFWLLSDLRILRFKWVGCQLMCDSTDFGCQFDLVWDSSDFVGDFLQKWSFEDQKRSFVRDFLQKWSFEDQKRSFSARLPSKLKLWSSRTKLFCETSFKNEALKIKNEAILRDFLQKKRFEAQKRSFSARLPSKLTCWPDTWPQNSNTF